MSNPIKELIKKKDPLQSIADIDIISERQAILKGKSKLSSYKRKLVLWKYDTDKQMDIVQKLVEKLNIEKNELMRLRSEMPK